MEQQEMRLESGSTALKSPVVDDVCREISDGLLESPKEGNKMQNNVTPSVCTCV